LFGKRVCFEAVPAPQPKDPLPKIEWHLIGPTGLISAADWVKTFDCSVEEFLHRCKLGEPPPVYWKRRLYFEFYCQHGRVMIELAGPELEYDAGTDQEEDWRPLPESTPKPTEEDELRMNEAALEHGPDITILHSTGEVERIDPEEFSELSPMDESGAFQKELDRQAAAIDRAVLGAEDEEDDAVDSDHLAADMLLVSDLFEHSEERPLNEAIRNRHLPPDDKLSDAEIESLLKSLLVQMALACTALHVCEHFTSRDTYRLLREKIFTEWKFHPDLVGKNFTQNYMTSEYCPKCEAEVEAK
jgi:hypothetical protein